MVFRSLPHATEEPALSSPDVKGPIEHSSRSLILVYATCIYIASKVVDRPQYRGLLTAMLSAIIGQQVTSKEVRGGVGVEKNIQKRRVQFERTRKVLMLSLISFVMTS